MCRIPRVLLVAPSDLHAELRRKLSSLEYEITVAVERPAEAQEITADVAVVWEPADGDVEALSARGLKVVALGGSGAGADLTLPPSDVAEVKTRIWDLLRAR